MGEISLDADWIHVLWCCGSICQQVLTFIQIGFGHTVTEGSGNSAICSRKYDIDYAAFQYNFHGSYICALQILDEREWNQYTNNCSKLVCKNRPNLVPLICIKPFIALCFCVSYDIITWRVIFFTTISFMKAIAKHNGIISLWIHSFFNAMFFYILLYFKT